MQTRPARTMTGNKFRRGGTRPVRFQDIDLLEDVLAGDDSFHADAADQFLELALVDLAAQVEQLADQHACGFDRDAARDERTQRTLGPLFAAL